MQGDRGGGKGIDASDGGGDSSGYSFGGVDSGSHVGDHIVVT